MNEATGCRMQANRAQGHRRASLGGRQTPATGFTAKRKCSDCAFPLESCILAVPGTRRVMETSGSPEISLQHGKIEPTYIHTLSLRKLTPVLSHRGASMVSQSSWSRS